jgi:DNA polymerase-1
VLNFSIAYGKTARGLSKDWGVSLQEAEETVERWYADRPEVRQWQEEQRRSATVGGGEGGEGRAATCRARALRRDARPHLPKLANHGPPSEPAAHVATPPRPVPLRSPPPDA